MTTTPRTHAELAHHAIDLDLDNALDELHDRDLDALADDLAPHFDAIRAAAIALHDSIYALQPAKFLDTIPMTDDDADLLALELPDACDDADCCQRAHDFIASFAYSYYRD